MPKNKADRSWTKQEKSDFEKGLSMNALENAKRNLAALFVKQEMERARGQSPDPTQDSINAAFRSRTAAAPSVSGYQDMPEAYPARPQFSQLRQAIRPGSAAETAQAIAQANMTPEQLEEEANKEKLARLQAAAAAAAQRGQ